MLDEQTATDQENIPQTSKKDKLEDEIIEIKGYIADYKSDLKKARRKVKLYFYGLVLLISIGAGIAYWFIQNYKLLSNPSHDPDTALLFTVLGTVAMGTALGIFNLISNIITEQTRITSIKADMGIWEDKEMVRRQFAENSEKPSYFDSLVRINVDSLKEYYALAKLHTEKSYKLVVRVSIFGFFLITVGLIVGLIDITNSHMISYISTASGIIIEFISSIFFLLYNRTVRQMKEYHADLLDVQNILLSLKLIENTSEENEKAKMLGQMLAHLIEKRHSSAISSEKE